MYEVGARWQELSLADVSRGPASPDSILAGIVSTPVAGSQGPRRPSSARFAGRSAVTVLAMPPPPSSFDSPRVIQAESSSSSNLFFRFSLGPVFSGKSSDRKKPTPTGKAGFGR